MKLFKYLTALGCAVACFSVGAANMTPSWVAMGAMDTDDLRKERLFKALCSQSEFSINDALNAFAQGKLTQEGVEKVMLVNGIHPICLPEHGVAFNFDGTPDVLFCDELKNRSREEITVFLPAFGSGRSIADTLSLHNGAKIIANDIQDHLKGDAQKLLGTYGFGLERLTFLMGDIFKVVDGLPNNSIDIVYMPNLIHFFSPFKIEKLLINLRPKLKDDAKVFLIWKGFSEQHPIVGAEQCAQLEKNTQELESLKLPYPRYVEKGDFKEISGQIYPYYAAYLFEMVRHIDRSGYSLGANGEEQMIQATLFVKELNLAIPLGDYKVQAPKLPNSTLNNYMVISPSKTIQQAVPEVDEEEAFFAKRRELLKAQLQL